MSEVPEPAPGPDPEDTPVGGMWTSMVRTAVPYIVGLVVAKLAEWGVNVDTGQVTGLVTLAFGTIYYTAVRFAEQKWPKLGWLLGSPKKPDYRTS